MRTLCLLVLAVVAPGCASNTLEAREARGEERAEEVDSLLRKAEQNLDRLEPEAADKILGKAKDLFADPELGLSPEKSLLERRYQEAADRLPAVRAARAKRDHDQAVAARKALVERELRDLEGSMSELSLERPTKKGISNAKEALEELVGVLGEGRDLEPDKEYAAWADKVRKRHSDALATVGLAADLERFLAGPGEMLREARGQVAAAKAASEPKHRVDALAVAVEKLKACGDEGKAMVARNGAIAAKPLAFAEGTLSPSATLAACAAELKDADKRLGAERKALAAWIKKQEAAEKARLKAEAAAKAKQQAAERRQKAAAAKKKKR